ncbi:MAG: S41 family peptidase [bacterium]|nr:S41 family peptidase [bacterium]
MKHRFSRTGALERRLIILCTLMFLMGVALVTKMPQRIAAMETQRKNDPEFYQFADVFSEVFEKIRQQYVTDVPARQLYEGAINGMFATLDGHSSWLPPDDQEMLIRDTEGEYSGVGLQIQIRDNILTVVSPIPGTPGAKAGVMPWDRIVEIDGQSTKDITIIEAVKKLTGPEGSTVKLKIYREGVPEPLNFEIRRETIKVESVFSKIIDGDIGYLRISQFKADTSGAVRGALKDFNRKGVKGIIVDLRNDPGGLLDEAVKICDMFLPKKQLIVSIRGRNSANNREYYSLEDPICPPSVPLLVLVNHGSASASEIFTGAMKDTKRGVIMGPKGSSTFGKGSVQTISALKNSLETDDDGNPRGSGIRLTTALYYTPAGVSIQESKGIKPDIGVELPPGHELALLRHGLLGEPNMVEPAAPKGQATPGGADTPTTGGLTSPTRGIVPAPPAAEPSGDDAATTAPRTPALPSPAARVAEGAAKDVFHDILLDEGVKYLKAFMIWEGRPAAA